MLVLAGQMAFAQADSSRVFIGAGAGMNFGFDGLPYVDRPNSHNGAGTAADFYVGGWLAPVLGVRAGYQGFGISDKFTDYGCLKYTYIHGDIILRPHKNILPYVHGGFVKIVNPTLGGGAGVMLPIHLTNHLSIVPDLKATVYSGKAYNVGKTTALTLSATVGVAYRFGGPKKKVQEPMPAIQIQHDTIYVPEYIKEVETKYVRDTVYVKGDVRRPETIRGLALFDFDKYDLRPEVLPELDKIANWFFLHPSARGIIEGHTDSIASAEYNQTLSERRAQAVYRYLVDKGVAPARLSYVGYGLTRPVATNSTPEGRQQNRRVEITVEEDEE